MDFTFVESKKDHGRDCFVCTGHSGLDLMGIESCAGGRTGLPVGAQESDAFTRTPRTCW